MVLKGGPLAYSSVVLEGGCKCVVNLVHPLRIAVHSSDIYNKIRTKSKFLRT
jgi:hypothetical protein